MAHLWLLIVVVCLWWQEEPQHERPLTSLSLSCLCGEPAKFRKRASQVFVLRSSINFECSVAFKKACLLCWFEHEHKCQRPLFPLKWSRARAAPGVSHDDINEHENGASDNNTKPHARFHVKWSVNTHSCYLFCLYSKRICENWSSCRE